MDRATALLSYTHHTGVTVGTWRDNKQEGQVDYDDANDAWWNREETDEELEAGAQRLFDELYGGVLPTAKQFLADVLLLAHERKQNAAQN